ncbi:ROK family protein [Paracoccus aminophilus]|uniref:Transcriptional regulator, ROK family n=1 Tax=Paracoccus aminophilus JCM 7686 TaxID=1367847 RepID=S5YEA0_PARAH|nr:ROK family protein [Paracoccus aminophilus]AGT09818.1 transcriptional regulator, ROK family [Paracoccus aminophilus JCM 7686]
MVAEVFLGVDVGGTKVHALLTDPMGTVLAEAREPTAPTGGLALADQIAQLADRLCAQAGCARPVAAGIGLPASVDPVTRALSVIPNIPEMAGTGFFPALQARLGGRIALENDVSAAALGEAWLGESGDPLAFVALGTGIGMGLIHRGEIFRGCRGGAGEIAFLPLGADPADPEIRQSGALEEVLGGKGWRRAYQAAKGQSEPDLAQLFAANDPVFELVITNQAALLARALLSVSALVAPEVIVLGGSIGMQPKLIAATTAALAEICPHPPRICPSRLGPRAGALGAARAAMLG